QRKLQRQDNRQQPEPPQISTSDGKEDEEDRERDHLEDHRRRIRNGDQQLTLERELPDHRRILDDGCRRADGPLVDRQPGDQSRDETVAVTLPLPSRSRNHEGEDEPVENDQAQRLEGRPGEAEGRPCETGVEVSPYQFSEKMKIAVNGRSSRTA